jgi:stage IV sporulation protein FB
MPVPGDAGQKIVPGNPLGVIFNEPPQTPYDLRFRVLGIPVRVHPLFWLVSAIMGARGNQEPREMLIWVATVFISILVHELGHALVARAYGWAPWITLYSFGGLASYRPTDRSALKQIIISFAGPAAGFLFAGVIVALIVASGHRVGFGWPRTALPVLFEFYENDNLNRLLFDLLYVNIFWGLVNLLPIWPLDGGKIAQEVLQTIHPRDGLVMSLWLSIFVAVGAGILAWVRLHDGFLMFFCGYLAYTSYQSLQALTGGGWGGYR